MVCTFQPLRLLQQVPSAFSIVGQRRPRQLDFFTFVVCIGLGLMQCLQHPGPHFGSRCKGEGDRQYLFRLVHCCQ